MVGALCAAGESGVIRKQLLKAITPTLFRRLDNGVINELMNNQLMNEYCTNNMEFAESFDALEHALCLNNYNGVNAHGAPSGHSISMETTALNSFNGATMV
jgi:hypothetical protein